MNNNIPSVALQNGGRLVTMEESCFPVHEIPAMLPNNNEGLMDSETGHKFIVTDEGKVISCMTNDYKLITNKSLMDTTLPIINKNGGVLQEAVVSGDKGAKTFWKFGFADTPVVTWNDENESYPTVEIWNSYDGSTEIKIMSGTFRLICSNGMTIGTVVSNQKNKHLNGNNNLDILDTLISNAIEDAVQFGNVAEELSKIKVRPNDIVKLANDIFNQNSIETYTQKVMLNKPETYWDLLNICTNMTSHSMRRDTHATRKVEQRLVPYITNLANISLN